MASPDSISRGQFLRLTAAASAGYLLTACKRGTPTPTPTLTVPPEATTDLGLPPVPPTHTQIPIPTATVVLTLAPSTPTDEIAATKTPDSLTGKTWNLQSVDFMKWTKDVQNNPPADDFIKRCLDAALAVGASHVALDQPVDYPEKSLEDTFRWTRYARERNLNIFHRHMSSPYEGIWGFENQKDPTLNYAQLFAAYIINNPDLFQPGDLIGSPPEPTNGGIQGTTYCPQEMCIYPDIATFNQKLREIQTQTDAALEQIGLKGQVTNGLYGFDGFVVAGINNPDWQGKSQLESTTVSQLPAISLDHYPDNPEAQMEPDLNLVLQTLGQVQLFISEWGTIHGEAVDQMRQTLEVFRKIGIIGMNYWHMGPASAGEQPEALLNLDFSPRPQYLELQAWYTGKR